MSRLFEFDQAIKVVEKDAGGDFHMFHVECYRLVHVIGGLRTPSRIVGWMVFCAYSQPMSLCGTGFLFDRSDGR